MEENQRILWSFVAIAVFGVVVYLFRRTQTSRLGILIPTMLGVAITMGMVLVLFEI